MMDLRDTTSYLLRAPDVGTWLKLADNYMQTRNRMPTQFVLPAKHAVLQPVIEAFASDSAAFAEYIRAMRDAAEGTAYDELHELYRTISTRAIQAARRERVNKALELLLPKVQERLDRELTYDDKLAIVGYIQSVWGALRVSLLSRERASITAKHLPADDRTVLLEAFWKDIEKKLAKGETPWFDLTDILTEVLPK